jgi:hypothetical protein
MATVSELKSLVDTYGVGVRAGLITPQIDDEIYFRDIMGLPKLSDAAKQSWAETDNVRRPITLAMAGETAAPMPAMQEGEE